MKDKILVKLQEFAYFIWLILLVFIAVFVTYFYDTNKKNQIYFLQKSFDNVYLKKSLTSLTAEFKPRYVSLDYKVQSGDTYENIIDTIDIPKEEKKLFLDNVKKNKEVKEEVKEKIKVEEPLVLHKKDIAEKATKETKQETKSSLTFGV